ncbi:MAG: TIGR01212 family radical SAM protein [Butyrivibrio sp.]|uniref:TIGR01212 family radical SAM protein n=1 Tax=Butyrivibrio sp. TaxID=28121 RepID=UPI001B2C1F23|nr:TIGR01212 family radical SAM protein [Butyrivibrio sp.]MBO6240490.1 TIGR01212 family radical SAM protein [Butyrivibrio sp.]
MHQKLSTYLKSTYGEKIYRLSLTSGCSCPNRDGSIIMPGGEKSFGGCTFCSEGGSGDFAVPVRSVNISDMNDELLKAREKIKAKTNATRFIAYFQSFTNTYGDVNRLKELYSAVIQRDDIVILSLGTRPDCIGSDVLAMLKELNKIKPVWVELGLQTIHEKSAIAFNRGYDLAVFEDAYKRLKEAGITTIVHVILGLFGETKEDMLETIRYLAHLSPVLDGIKLQNLQLLKGTQLYRQYLEMETKDRPHFMDMEEYTDLVAQCIALLPEKTVIHRMTGDGPRKLLVEPLWSLDKKRVLNMLTKKCAGILE